MKSNAKQTCYKHVVIALLYAFDTVYTINRKIDIPAIKNPHKFLNQKTASVNIFLSNIGVKVFTCKHSGLSSDKLIWKIK